LKWVYAQGVNTCSALEHCGMAPQNHENCCGKMLKNAGLAIK